MMFVIWLLVPVALMVLGFTIGTIRERRHLGALARREEAASSVVVVDVAAPPPGTHAIDGALVMGEVVIASDYFKTFAAWLRNLVGGELRTYQTLLSRARREARLRMIDQARSLGATTVVNVRYEWSAVGPRLPSTEIFCSGTALITRAP